MINLGASVNKVNDSSKTALWAAVDGGHVDICKLLLDNRAIIDSADDNKTCTPLHSASIHGNIDLCKLLIMKGACVNKVDDRGETPLLVAAKAGHADICILLEGRDADISCMANKIERLPDIGSQKMRNLLLIWKDELGKMFRIAHLVTCLTCSSMRYHSMQFQIHCSSFRNE